MAREGARVAVSDLTEEGAATTVALINAAGGKAIAIGANVSIEAEVAGWDLTIPQSLLIRADQVIEEAFLHADFAAGTQVWKWHSFPPEVSVGAGRSAVVVRK